ncbi:MAG: queuosine precursor transporter [Candidatus Paracaedimonas acanthamoebae]|uniref:Probable queuosine precursor transporter n=1 Tax=Candidatus Paracaedimonas acanthamoebae TaxID=244581 RepID=A0A8J7Q059_9PROT|nr:queuosine precursor transporter [Candidatus Paracaedimonas acanthamoebae]
MTLISLTRMVDFFQSLPSEAMGCLTFLICSLAILGIFRYYGALGLFIYNSLAIIAGNLQVLKAGEFSFLNYPIALGTVVFSSSFLTSDILTEYYGKQIAQKSVWLSFLMSLLLSILMLLTLGVKPIATINEDYIAFNKAHEAMSVLFLPIPTILIASLSAYLISQYTDIYIFQYIKNLTKGKALWLRSSLAFIVSSSIDNIIFSTLAWVILASHPVEWKTLIYTYILGTYTIRLLVSLANTLIMYLVRFINPFRKNLIDVSLSKFSV